MWAKYVAVALTAASPIGEELVSIPLGVGLGLDPALVAVISVVFNMLPALVISALFRRAERGTGVLRVMLRMRLEPFRSAIRWMLRRRSQPAVAGAGPLGSMGSVDRHALGRGVWYHVDSGGGRDAPGAGCWRQSPQA